MKLDPNTLKEIDKSVDTFFKKNKMALDNAKEIKKLRSDLDGFYRAYGADTKYVEKIKDDVGRLEKEIKQLKDQIRKLEKAKR